MQPSLSIITPSLNQGAFIERTIRSVLDQGYPNLEYVILDGGSSDETVEIIKRYEDRLAWWVSEPDAGQTAAINRGIEGTSGEIVAYINSDDYYLPGAFEKAVAAFEASGASWVAGAALDLDQDDRPVEMGVYGGEPGVQPAEPPQAWERTIAGRQWWMLHPWATPQPSTFWRRELFERFGPFRRDMHFAFDAEFMLRLAYAGEMPELLDDRLAVRVTHPRQKSSDATRWAPEKQKLIELYRPSLTAAEKRRLAIVRALRGAGFYELPDRVWHPLLRLGGRMLDHLPERIRPAIRDRDR